MQGVGDCRGEVGYYLGTGFFPRFEPVESFDAFALGFFGLACFLKLSTHFAGEIPFRDVYVLLRLLCRLVLQLGSPVINYILGDGDLFLLTESTFYGFGRLVVVVFFLGFPLCGLFLACGGVFVCLDACR